MMNGGGGKGMGKVKGSGRGGGKQEGSGKWK